MSNIATPFADEIERAVVAAGGPATAVTPNADWLETVRKVAVYDELRASDPAAGRTTPVAAGVDTVALNTEYAPENARARSISRRVRARVWASADPVRANCVRTSRSCWLVSTGAAGTGRMIGVAVPA